MNKYTNSLLFGFLLFIVGIIIVNFDLKDYRNVKYLPDGFESTTEQFKIEIDSDKKYSFKKVRNQKNIIIEKIEVDGYDDFATVKVKHSSTSRAYSTIKASDNNVEVIFSNQAKFPTKQEIGDIYKLFLQCIQDKTIYNYSLLKYSRVTILGNKDVLSRIEIEEDE